MTLTQEPQQRQEQEHQQRVWQALDLVRDLTHQERRWMKHGRKVCDHLNHIREERRRVLRDHNLPKWNVCKRNREWSRIVFTLVALLPLLLASCKSKPQRPEVPMAFKMLVKEKPAAVAKQRTALFNPNAAAPAAPAPKTFTLTNMTARPGGIWYWTWQTNLNAPPLHWIEGGWHIDSAARITNRFPQQFFKGGSVNKGSAFSWGGKQIFPSAP